MATRTQPSSSSRSNNYSTRVQQRRDGQQQQQQQHVKSSTFAKRRGHSMSWTGVHMTSYTSRGFCSSSSDYEEHLILDNVSGSAPSGQVTAIMGESGSGKTSLLNVLSGRVESIRNKLAVSAHSIVLDGKPVDPVADISVRQRIAFCAQEDSLPVTATPREAIYFSARLRLSKTITEAELHDMTDVMLTELHLDKCADTYVGGTLVKGLSGGERKRTTMGVELVTRPNLLLADEPTSGLDSFNAAEVCLVLKKIARAGSAVLVTIHQPSSDIYTKLIDRLILLKQGSVMYNGPARHVFGFFQKCGYPCPAHHNPADWIITVAQTQTKEQLTADGFFSTNNEPKKAHHHHHGDNTKRYLTDSDDDDGEDQLIVRSSRTHHLCSTTDPPGGYWQQVDARALANFLSPPVVDDDHDHDPQEESSTPQTQMSSLPSPNNHKNNNHKRLVQSSLPFLLGHRDSTTSSSSNASTQSSVMSLRLPGEEGETEVVAVSGGRQQPQQLQKVGFWTQLELLVSREVKGLVRNKKNITTRAGMTTTVGLMGGCIFLGVAENDLSDYVNVQTAFGALLVALLSNVFSTALPSLVAFPEERPVFLREYSTNHYSVTAYFVSRFSMELFVTALQVTVSTMFTYNMIGFSQPYGAFWACLYTFAMSSTSLAVLIGCSVKDPDMAIELLPLALMPQILFAGFFAPPDLMPVWLRWAAYLFPLTYATRIVVVNEFDGACDDQADSLLDGLNVSDSILDTVVQVVGEDAAAALNTTQNFCDTVMDVVEAKPEDTWWYWIILVGECALFRLLALFILRNKATSFY